ncbi:MULTISPECIES: NACHT domain-containing protein [Kamptonema]|uniref:NACHT domain-containing protein n=1 Tax=Kamptonema TaxID=1501433 RepID=UPI0001DACB48|nr:MULTISPECIES: hypothetical protein [Kamptonema]CBN57514.1 Similar to tr/Q8TRD7/Q8TRD7 (modular protein) [Kamptonema sp. PCC 6506]
MNIDDFKHLFPFPENWINTILLLLFFRFLPFIIKSIIPLTKLYSTFKEFKDCKILTEKLSRGAYDKETIQQSTKYYISPKCSNIDPAQEEEVRQALMATRESLFDKIDYFLDHDSSKRHLLILADSGTGKTSFVLNYYAYNLRRSQNKSQNLFLVPLGLKDADTQISEYENKNETVIFLDALDEDTKAIEDHRTRIRYLMDACRDYKRVIITCRTQFFPNDEEMPVETGIARLGPRKAGEKGVYEFWKLYLSPFDDNDIDLYLQKRFPFWLSSERKKAKELAYRIKSLSVRPMLLAHIPDVIESGYKITQSYQLYQLMVDAWLERESSWVSKSELGEYSERLAVNLYVNREKRGMERIPYEELEGLANEWNSNLIQWQLSGRSLLNRDAQGNYKFAHRSIMEYLYVKRLLQGDFDCSGVILTDQMKRFLIEIIATKSDNFSIDRVLEFLLKIEVSIDYEDRITLERNKQNAIDKVPNDNDLEELINAQKDFLIKLNEFSNDAMILIRLIEIYPFSYRDIDEVSMKISGVNDELFLKLQNLGFSNSYIKQVLELLLPDLFNSSREYFIRRDKTRLIIRSQIYSIEMGIENKLGKIIENEPDKAIENKLEEKIEIETESSSRAEIHRDVKRFVELYGINGVISFSFINQLPFCKIEPLYPSLNNFSLRINTSALLL